ncbi:hypothetical protein HOY82DRAFT_601277 [Tuber indicum]|nr:hypothetical protein HOY82DRAFT_601277 [Tuber indicum]
MTRKRVEHLIASGTFTEQLLLGGMPNGSSLEAEVSQLLDEWEQARAGYHIITSKIDYDTLRDRRRDQMGLLPLIMEHEKAAQSFKSITSDNVPTVIKDSSGVVLGYHFHIPTSLINSLKDSRALLAPLSEKASNGKQGPGSVVKDMAKTNAVSVEPMQPLAGAWHGVAINEGLQDDESKSHLDWLDDQNLFNCLLPFGNGFSGGERILWALKIKLE